jgi:diguanylate cyclase (GGDEF)-like protein
MTAHVASDRRDPEADEDRRAASPGRAVLEAIDAAAYEWRIPSDALEWSAGVEALLGCVPRTGAAWAELIDPDALATRASVVLGTGRRDEGAGVPYDVEYCLRLGERQVWIEDFGRWYADAKGRPMRAHGMFRVVTSRHEAEQRLALEGRDSLTGTLTRLKLLDVLDLTLSDAKRYQDSCALLLIAVENLGAMNEAYGHEAADQFIAGVAKRLRTLMRTGDAIGRFSTTTFALVLNRCGPTDLDVAARRFLAAVHDEPLEGPFGTVIVRVSGAGVVGPRHARSPDEMITHAGETLRMVRSQCSGSFMAFVPGLHPPGVRGDHLALVQELMHGLRERRLRLAYQPVVGAADRALAWYEALARFTLADGSATEISPYILAAEKLGLVQLLDQQALELGLAALADDPHLKVAINVSANTTADLEWRARIGRFLDERPGDAARLVVEITETAAFADLDHAAAFVRDLHSRGVGLALDDFGAGHTSFRALRALGVDLVKIDGGFVTGAPDSAVDRAFIRAVVELAHDVGFKTVAECVETPAQADLLAGIGVDYFQGNLFGVPAPLPERHRT